MIILEEEMIMQFTNIYSWHSSGDSDFPSISQQGSDGQSLQGNSQSNPGSQRPSFHSNEGEDNGHPTSEADDIHSGYDYDANNNINEARRYISILPNVNGICLKSEAHLLPSLSMVSLLGGIDFDTYQQVTGNKPSKPAADRTPGSGASRPQIPTITMGRAPGASNERKRLNPSTPSSLSFAAERIVVTSTVSKANEMWLANLLSIASSTANNNSEELNPASSPTYNSLPYQKSTNNSGAIDNPSNMPGDYSDIQGKPASLPRTRSPIPSNATPTTTSSNQPSKWTSAAGNPKQGNNPKAQQQQQGYQAR